jgi:hypothetical protein
MTDTDCNPLTCWRSDSAGDVEVAFACETMKTKGVVVFDPFLLARTRLLLLLFVLATAETRCTAVFRFSAIMHTDPFVRNTSQQGLGGRYLNRYPDTRHTSVLTILVISFASAMGSMSGPLCAQTPPEGSSYPRTSISPEWVVLVKLYAMKALWPYRYERRGGPRRADCDQQMLNR